MKKGSNPMDYRFFSDDELWSLWIDKGDENARDIWLLRKWAAGDDNKRKELFDCYRKNPEDALTVGGHHGHLILWACRKAGLRFARHGFDVFQELYTRLYSRRQMLPRINIECFGGFMLWKARSAANEVAKKLRGRRPPKPPPGEDRSDGNTTRGGDETEPADHDGGEGGGSDDKVDGDTSDEKCQSDAPDETVAVCVSRHRRYHRPGEIVGRLALREIIDKCQDKLKLKERKVCDLYYGRDGEGLTAKQIAARLGSTPAYIWKSACMIAAKMRQCFEKHGLTVGKYGVTWS